MLTGNKDTEYIVLSNLDDRTLFNYCQTDKSAKKICSNDAFWKSRFTYKFGEKYLKFKSGGKNWKKFYLEIVSIIDMDDINQVELLDENEYIDFLRKIFKLSLDKPDVFNFFEKIFPNRIDPIFLEPESAMLIQKNFNPGLSPFKQLLGEGVTSMKILKNVLEQLDLDVNEIKIKNNLSANEEQYLKQPVILRYIDVVENDPNFSNEKYIKL